LGYHTLANNRDHVGSPNRPVYDLLSDSRTHRVFRVSVVFSYLRSKLILFLGSTDAIIYRMVHYALRMGLLTRFDGSHRVSSPIDTSLERSSVCVASLISVPITFPISCTPCDVAFQYGATRWSGISVGLTLPLSGLYVTAMLAKCVSSMFSSLSDLTDELGSLHTRSSLRELSENEMTAELVTFREGQQTTAVLLDGDSALPFPTASASNSARVLESSTHVCIALVQRQNVLC
jgi:hypothetical protein